MFLKKIFFILFFIENYVCDFFTFNYYLRYQASLLFSLNDPSNLKDFCLYSQKYLDIEIDINDDYKNNILNLNKIIDVHVSNNINNDFTDIMKSIYKINIEKNNNFNLKEKPIDDTVNVIIKGSDLSLITQKTNKYNDLIIDYINMNDNINRAEKIRNDMLEYINLENVNNAYKEMIEDFEFRNKNKKNIKPSKRINTIKMLLMIFHEKIFLNLLQSYGGIVITMIITVVLTMNLDVNEENKTKIINEVINYINSRAEEN